MAKKNKRKNMFAGVLGLTCCLAGASLSFIYGGIWLVKMIEPTVRGWHVSLQFFLFAFIVAVLLIVGWVIPRLTICKIPWIARNL